MKNKGSFSIEYAVLISVIVLALLGISQYAKRAICGKYRESADVFGQGRQFVTDWEMESDGP